MDKLRRAAFDTVDCRMDAGGTGFSFAPRIPAALAITIVPPLGLVGFLCPLTGAGFIFPGCMWAGLVLTALIPGAFCALTDPLSRTYRNKMYSALAASLVLAIVAHLAGWGQVEPPLDWATVNTHFGDVSLPFKDYEAAQFVQQQASDSKAKVLIFPEFVVPRWSEAIAGFWEFEHLRKVSCVAKFSFLAREFQAATIYLKQRVSTEVRLRSRDQRTTKSQVISGSGSKPERKPFKTRGSRAAR